MHVDARFVILTAALSASPLAAATPAPQNVRQDVHRLTLLHGPTLLSGPHDPKPATVSSKTITVGDENRWSFRPAPGSNRGGGSLTLRPAPDVQPVAELKTVRPDAKSATPPPFDASLPSTPTPALLEQARRPAPR